MTFNSRPFITQLFSRLTWRKKDEGDKCEEEEVDEDGEKQFELNMISSSCFIRKNISC